MKKITLFLLILPLITSCTKIEWQERDICDKFNCEMAKPTNENISISISKKPMLNEVVDISVVYDSGGYRGNIKLAVDLTDGYQHILGDKEFNGFVLENQNVELKIRAKAVQIGGWTLTAYFEHDGARQPILLYAPVLKEGIDESMLVPIPPMIK